MRKFLVLFLICLTVLVTGSCNRNSGGANTSAGGQQTLSYWLQFEDLGGLVMNNWDDNVVWQHKEKVTGVKINFISPAVGEEELAFNLMLSSNDLPDMIQFQPYDKFSYPGGPSKAVADGVFLRLNELIAKNAPNFTKFINSKPDIKRQVLTDDGLLWGMGMLEAVNQTNYYGPIIREDWLKELGLAMPVTVADWHNVLTQFKIKKGAAAPWVMDSRGKGFSFPWAYDIDTNIGWLQRDGKMIYSYTDPGFLEYLTEMNRWYKEGLIPQDFIQSNNERNSWLTNGISGAYDRGFWEFTNDENMIREKDPKAVLAPAPLPIKDSGSTTKIRILEPHNRGTETVVTSSCKDPDLAVKWLDWNYSDEGYYWLNYGEEGFSYNMVNGKPVWTDFMTKNPEGYDLNQLMRKYCIQNGSMVRDWQSIFVAYSPAVNLTLTLWDGDSSHFFKTELLSFTADEGNTNANIMADIDVYVSEMTIKFITGQEPLSNWNRYVGNVNSMGLATVVKNYQTAYDRYLNRK